MQCNATNRCDIEDNSDSSGNSNIILCDRRRDGMQIKIFE